MSLIDTHVHLYAEEFEKDLSALMEQAQHAGVSKFFLPNIDTESLSGMVAICERWKGVCFPMYGLHPCSVKDNYESELDIIRKALEENRSSVIAIGETGLDFYWDLTFKAEQEKAFREQAEWAVEFDLPIVIHSRDSTDALISIIKDINDPRLKGVFHCFSGNLLQANEIMDLGFYLGIGGVVTFKNGGLDKIIPEIPLNKIVLETDGPYLAPVPYRGKRNEPAYLKIVAEKMAALKGISLEELSRQTTENALKLFKI